MRNLSLLGAAIIGCSRTLAMILAYGLSINLLLDNPRQGISLIISLLIFHFSSNRLRGCPEVWDVRDMEGGENEW